MKVIYKYRVVDQIEMPKNALLLSVAMQRNILTLWALVDTEEPLIRRLFFVVRTGFPLDSEVKQETFFITIQDPPFVWHIFDLGEEE